MKKLIALMIMLFISPPPASASNDVVLSKFAENVTTHVLLHELAHALIREFDLPVLGNEEVMADNFATFYTRKFDSTKAKEIVQDRALSWLLESKQAGLRDRDLQGEYPLDRRRAFRSLCHFYGSDPEDNHDFMELFRFSQSEAGKCQTTSPEVERSWRRTLSPLWMPEGMLSREVNVIYGEGPMKKAMMKNGLLERIAIFASRFDWHSQITLNFDHCDQEAEWRRNSRTILLCDDYVSRFLEQGSKSE